MPITHAVCVGLIARKLPVVELKTFRSRILDFGNYNVVKSNAHSCNCNCSLHSTVDWQVPRATFIFRSWELIMLNQFTQILKIKALERYQLAALKFDFVLSFSVVDIEQNNTMKMYILC